MSIKWDISYNGNKLKSLYIKNKMGHFVAIKNGETDHFFFFLNNKRALFCYHIKAPG